MGNWDVGTIVKSLGLPQSHVGDWLDALALRIEAPEYIPISSGLLHRGAMVGVVSVLPPVSGGTLLSSAPTVHIGNSWIFP